MYVRLGFSVAINVDPDILLVDEVLAVGDEEFQRRCSEKFAELKYSGKTVVIVSHALGTVRNLCDQVALLEHGKLIAVGPAGQVIDEYLEDVHVDRIADGEYGSRWGSGEGKIERVELLAADGTPATNIHTGDALTIRLHYALSEPIPKPVFGLAIQTIEGFTVTGPNTRQAGAVPDQLSGEGNVDLRVDRLMLAPGTYDLSASLYDYSCSHAFDYRHRTLRFDVERGDPVEEHGVMALGGSWEGAVSSGPGR